MARRNEDDETNFLELALVAVALVCFFTVCALFVGFMFATRDAPAKVADYIIQHVETSPSSSP